MVGCKMLVYMKFFWWALFTASLGVKNRWVPPQKHWAILYTEANSRWQIFTKMCYMVKIRTFQMWSYYIPLERKFYTEQLLQQNYTLKIRLSWDISSDVERECPVLKRNRYSNYFLSFYWNIDFFDFEQSLINKTFKYNKMLQIHFEASLKPRILSFRLWSIHTERGE